LRGFNFKRLSIFVYNPETHIVGEVEKQRNSIFENIFSTVKKIFLPAKEFMIDLE